VPTRGPSFFPIRTKCARKFCIRWGLRAHFLRNPVSTLRVFLPDSASRASGFRGLRHLEEPSSGHPGLAHRRSGGVAGDPRQARHAGDPEEQRGVRLGPDPGHRRRHSMAHPPRICRPGVPIQQGRDVPTLHRWLQAAGRRSAARSWASTPVSPRPRASLGRKPSGDGRPFHQGRACTARASIRTKHAHVRAPWIGCTTTFGRGVGAARATSCLPRVNEQKERHLANSLRA